MVLISCHYSEHQQQQNFLNTHAYLLFQRCKSIVFVFIGGSCTLHGPPENPGRGAYFVFVTGGQEIRGKRDIFEYPQVQFTLLPVCVHEWSVERNFWDAISAAVKRGRSNPWCCRWHLGDVYVFVRVCMCAM
eukprot:GHVU01229514.1.p2 GENE.GHVU01229514.1~~GHVU01229514.1.p2  ORF type:complete len:132 (+),score=3.88 GHVU01229514.1:1-396(+)